MCIYIYIISIIIIINYYLLLLLIIINYTVYIFLLYYIPLTFVDVQIQSCQSPVFWDIFPQSLQGSLSLFTSPRIAQRPGDGRSIAALVPGGSPEVVTMVVSMRKKLGMTGLFGSTP